MMHLRARPMSRNTYPSQHRNQWRTLYIPRRPATARSWFRSIRFPRPMMLCLTPCWGSGRWIHCLVRRRRPRTYRPVVNPFGQSPLPTPFPLSVNPHLKPSGEKLYGLRPRDKPVPKLKGRPIDGWEYEPLIDERPAHSGAEDESIGKKLVEDTESSTRPAAAGLKTARSDRQPGEDTASKRISGDRQVPSRTEDGQSQEEAFGRFRRLMEGDGPARMIGGGPDTGPGAISGPRGGEALSVATRYYTSHLCRQRCQIGRTERRCP